MNDGLIICNDIFCRTVHQMQQHGTALHVAQKTVADSLAFMGTCNQSGNVGDHKFSAIHADNAEVRVQGGERIVRDFGASVGRCRQEGRFARIGQPQKAGVGNELQPQPDRAFDTGLTRIGATWCLVGKCC